MNTALIKIMIGKFQEVSRNLRSLKPPLKIGVKMTELHQCMGVFITTTGLNLTPNNGQQDLIIIAGASLSRQLTPRCHTKNYIGSENETRVGVGHVLAINL